MTSDFDNLGHIWRSVQEDARLIPVVNWLTDQCIKEADTRIPDKWTYAKWIEKANARRTEINETVEARKNDPLNMLNPNNLSNRFEYLGECHDVLDHRGGVRGKSKIMCDKHPPNFHCPETCDNTAFEDFEETDCVRKGETHVHSRCPKCGKEVY